MRIEGLEELNKKIDNLSSDMVSNRVHKAFSRGCQQILDCAKANVPVDTGELRESIFMKVSGGKGEYSGTIYTNKEYAPYVELGTGPVGQANHKGISPNVNPVYSQKGWSYWDEENKEFIHTKGQAAQPYMYPAFKDGSKDAVKTIETEVEKIIKEVCK